MSDKFSSAKTVGKNIIDVAVEESQLAVNEIDNPGSDVHKTIPEVRKRCKKIRGLVRLIRPVYKDIYKKENAWYRDAARDLSYYRDAYSIIETFDKLSKNIPVGAVNNEQIKEALVQRKDQIFSDTELIDSKLAGFRKKMLRGTERAKTWPFEEKDHYDMIGKGLKFTYKRGRNAMEVAVKSGSTMDFHEWRKRVKYHWYHLCLLKPAWDEVLEAFRNQAHELSEYLGDEHDLAVLKQILNNGSFSFLNSDSGRILNCVIDRQRAELQRMSKHLGNRLYCEKPGKMNKRMAAYIEEWQKW